jgi:hypothetical protein
LHPTIQEDPIDEYQPICQTCRQKARPEGHECTVPVDGFAARQSSLGFEELCPIGRFERRSVIYPASPEDHTYIEQLEALGRLDAANRQPGANVSAEAESIASNSELRAWLRESNRIADPKVLKGRADLVRQRRFGILRFLDGEDRGLPIWQPIPRHPLPEGQGFWLLRLRDELEWLIITVHRPTKLRPYVRPTKDRLNHREARAVLDWKASHLDMWLSDRPHQIGGRMAIDTSRSVIFDTDLFIRWVYALTN